MVLTANLIRKQIDLPTFESLRFSPLQSSAVSCSCAADYSNFHPQFGRYIYYLIAATSFYRYDTWTDSYTQLSSPPITPVTWSSMRFAGAMGLEGNALAATENSITIPGYYGKVFKGFDIYIINGTGIGQRKIINNVADVTVAETGVATTIANALGGISITDSTKAWIINQWAGYSLRITFGPGVSQVRRILYNSATVLYLADSVKSAETNYSNPMIFSPAISASAGTQSMYSIESSVVTVDSNWITQPDTTSVFRVMSGSIFLYSSAATNPFYIAQQYDIATDTWYIRTANTLNVSAAGTDGTVERCTENASIWDRGFASSGTVTTLVDSTKNWTVNQWAGHSVRIFTGTGENQLRPIISNTENTLTWTANGTAPDATSGYLIAGFDAGTATSGSTSTIVDSTKSWTVNRWSNYVVKVTGGTGKGQIIPILSNTATTLTLFYPSTFAFDSTTIYRIQSDNDKMYLMFGNNAGVLISNVDDDLATYGRRYDSGAARIASVRFGMNKPISIASATHATTTATITTTNNHGLKVGWSVTVKGFTDANYNTTATILTVPSLTTFTYTMAGTPAADTIATTAQSTSTLSDCTKAWTVNQWAGYLCYMTTSAVTAASGLATGQVFQIVSNTATTLTFVTTGTAPTNGVSRYVICARSIVGAIDDGIATGTQSTTSLQDTTKAGSFTGSMASGGNVLTISGVTSGKLYPGHAVTGTSIPAGTVIVNQLTGTIGGIGTYTLSNAATALISGATISSGWVVNIYAGKRCKIIGGTGQAQEFLITSNTINTLTLSGGVPTAPVTLISSYAILQQPIRGAGIELNWYFGTSDLTMRGKYMAVARGGGVLGFDRWDMTTDLIDLMPITPQIETLTIGTQYAYDGVDRLYYAKDGLLTLKYLDIVTNTVNGAGIIPYLVGTGIIGNRMEIFTSVDGLKYLWINRPSNTDMFRELLFW